MYTSDTIQPQLNFKDGKCILKKGRKQVAIIYHRPEFARAMGSQYHWDPQFPYSLYLPKLSVSKPFRTYEAMCAGVADALNKYI